jgi:hypothetical protein
LNEAEPDPDAMVVVAALVSRVEALVTASMLEAAGIDVHVGGAAHASVEVNSLALGGHRLWIPASQHEAASAVLLEVLGEDEWSFSKGPRRAILKMWAAVTVAALAVCGFFGVIFGVWSLYAAAVSPLLALPFPVNPQGRGDYFLRAADGRTYCA